MSQYSVAGNTSSYSFWLYRLVWRLVDWLYPPQCAGCGKGGMRWCMQCQEKVIKIMRPYCQKCGIPTLGGEICPTCLSKNPVYDAIRAYALYEEPLRSGLHRLKYKRDIALADVFALNLIELYYQQHWEIDLVTAVPLGLVRLKERGYNQASLLAYPFALAVRRPYRSNALKRIRETASQVTLSVQERLANVDGAFVADQALVNGKNILVIDDVTTTGATMNACAQALKNAGANQVFGLTLARAYHKKY
ncbi:MAG: ComF family protein [Anaerolineales bacterium]